MWRGRRIEDMTREELVEALTWCANAMRDQYAEAMRQSGVLAQFREMAA
jgi:ATP-dependent protease Clp ATPase subunit